MVRCSGVTLFLSFNRVQALRLCGGLVGSHANSSSGSTRGAGNENGDSTLEALDAVEFIVPLGVVAAIRCSRVGLL